jgi:hypothetical protein
VNPSTATFRAPWPASLTWLSIGSTALLVGVAILQATVIPRTVLNGIPYLLGIVLPATALVGCALYTIKGYEVDSTAVYVQRLLWRTQIPLAGLERAWASPEAMAGSIRFFGNGGLFSISGLFRNKRLGSYRAFATDPTRAVVLDFASRKVVLTPESPAAFLDHLRRVAPATHILAKP